MFYKKDKDGKKTLDKKQVAKAALNIGKLVADSQRTAPAAPGTDPGFVSMKRDKKPQAESQKELVKQSGEAVTPIDNSGTQEYDSATGTVGKKKPRTNNGSTFTRDDYKGYRS
jgi:hypothetical protein